jgi:toxin-antitoxin system PIN domain toxin
MKGYLLDVNVLLALAWPNHVHHVLAHAWFKTHAPKGWATCAVTQLGFVRLSSHSAFTPACRPPDQARALLAQICALPHHRFWPEPRAALLDPALDSVFARILTHNQVTDGYLLGVAAGHDGRLATLDEALARAFPQLADLVRPPNPS